MRIFVVAIAFAVTLGGLFLFENFKAPIKNTNYAAIVQTLKDPGQSTKKTTIAKSSKKSISTSSSLPTKTTTTITTSPSSSPLKITIHTATSSPTISPTPSTLVGSTQTNTPTPSATPSPTSTPLAITTPTPSATPTPTATQTPSHAVSESPTPSPSATPTASPEISSQPTDYSITVISFTSPIIARGNTAELKIQTAVSAQCSIKLTLPSGSVSSAQGLQTKTADADGIIDWQWKIGGSTKPSPPNAKIDLSCSKDGNVYSGYLQMTITD